MKKTYSKPVTENIKMEATTLMALSLTDKDNELHHADSQTPGGAPETGGTEVHEGDDDLGAAKRWGRYTWPYE